MRIKLFILFTAALLVLNLQPAASLAAVNTHDSSHMSGQNMDMFETAGSMPDHNMPDHNMDEMTDTETPHTLEQPGDEPGHGGHAGNGSGGGSEINRAGLLGGFGLINGFVILSAVILRRKTTRLEGGSGNER